MISPTRVFSLSVRFRSTEMSSLLKRLPLSPVETPPLFRSLPRVHSTGPSRETLSFSTRFCLFFLPVARVANTPKLRRPKTGRGRRRRRAFFLIQVLASGHTFGFQISMCCSFQIGRARFRADDARASEKKTLVWPEEERGFYHR